MLKAIAFDLGDTLILTSEGFKKTLDSKVEFRFLKKKYKDITIESYKTAVKNGMEKLLEMEPAERYKEAMPAFVLLREIGVAPTWKLAKEIAKVFFEEQKKHTKLFPLTKKVLKNLKEKRFVLGVISNAGFKKAIAWLEFFKIKEFFDIIIISEKLNTDKSGLLPFYKFLEKVKKYNIKAEEILMVGNDLSEDTFAKKLGLKVAILKPTLVRKKEEISPDYYLENLTDVFKILKDSNSQL